jgi:hypothetical protein
MLGPSSIFSSFEYDSVLERLWKQQFGGLNYDKKSGTVGGKSASPLSDLSPKMKDDIHHTQQLLVVPL